ncbi:DUF397 domain-containing protein [Streptomyces rubiginosohelvolus]
MDGNLYALSAPAAGAFADFCGGNAGGPHETCVSLAAIPGTDASFAIRDSKPEGVGKGCVSPGASSTTSPPGGSGPGA